jgi:hypothetical protein
MFSLLFSVIAVGLVLLGLGDAHTVLTYPGWRGDNLVTNDTFPYGMQWMYPCEYSFLLGLWKGGKEGRKQSSCGYEDGIEGGDRKRRLLCPALLCSSACERGKLCLPGGYDMAGLCCVLFFHILHR